MKSVRNRRPDRLQLFDIVQDMLNNRDWFSAHQMTQAIYYGRTPFPQQHKYVQKLIDEAVGRGDLIRNNTMAACSLYCAPFTPPANWSGNPFHQMLWYNPGVWHQDQLLAMYCLMDDLDRFVPCQPKTGEYDRFGRLPVPQPAYDPSCPYPIERLPGYDPKYHIRPLFKPPVSISA